MADDDIITLEFDSSPAPKHDDLDDISVSFLPPPSKSVIHKKRPAKYTYKTSIYMEERDEIASRRGATSITTVSRDNSRMDPIIKFMENWPYSDEIKSRAAQIYRNTGLSNQHPENKTQALFCYLFRTHQERGVHVEPYLLSKNIGLRPELIPSAFTKYMPLIESRFRIDGWIDPVESLPQYAVKLGLTDEFIGSMKESFRRLLDKSKKISQEERGEDLSEKPAKTIVAAYMLNYLQSMGNFPEEQNYADLFGLKIATIKNLSKKIDIIENK